MIVDCNRQGRIFSPYRRFEQVIFKRFFSQAHFAIDKGFVLCIISRTSLDKTFSFQKGGDRWRKTFEVFPIKTLSPHRKVRPVSLPDLLGYFKGLPEEQIIFGSNPDLEKVAETVLLTFSLKKSEKGLLTGYHSL